MRYQASMPTRNDPSRNRSTNSTAYSKSEWPSKEGVTGERSYTWNFGFVMELQAGMRTHYQNWRRVVDSERDIAASWVPITYYQERGWIERMRFLPGSVRAALRCQQQVREGLGTQRYDAVLFNTYNAAVLYPRGVRDQRAFLMYDVTPRQYDSMARWYGHNPDRSGRLAALKHQRVRETLRAAEGLFAWSHWAATSAVEDYGVDPSRISIVPSGVDTDLWYPLPEAERPNDGITRILFTGGNFERKGGDLLLRWARETTRRNWEMHLVTQDAVNAPPNVIVHNNIGSNAAELIQLAQKADIFALPTRADCFSIASLEAMAAGLPVITTTVGGIPDIVRDGQTGYLLAPDDYDGLHSRLETLLEMPDLRRQLGQSGREVVCAEFQSAMLVRRGLNIMQENRNEDKGGRKV